MRTVYHEFESIEHLLATRLLPGGDEEPVRCVIFGGTGAVGGASVMELCRLILMSKTLGSRPLSGEIHATGLGDKEISKFVGRLYLALEGEVQIEKITPLRHYRLDGRIDLRFDLLRLQIPADLDEHIAAVRAASDRPIPLETLLADYFAAQPCPFLGFVEALEADLLHAVVVAIPLPSVATYTLTSIDALLEAEGINHVTGQRIKKSYLDTFVRGLAVIQQRYARNVVMAHTTAVGGMYRVDGARAQIRLGFAHSALGKKLFDKKYFADELTQLYVDRGFDVLVTAAAIGVDAVELRTHLPSDRAVLGKLRGRLGQVEHEFIEPSDLDTGTILLYPCRAVPLDPQPPADVASAADSSEPSTASQTSPSTTDAIDSEIGSEIAAFDVERAPSDGQSGLFERPDPSRWTSDDDSKDDGALHFGAGKELIVAAAIRSGENGLFSVANCVALYNVMKVAIPEELAMVLVRRALFGPERRRDWFHDKISYYSETENSYFALRLFESYPRLVRSHHAAFAVQAYQNLGSSTHQARLHQLGLLMLLMRLRELARDFASIPEDELAAAVSDLDGFFWRRTRVPAFQDLDTLGDAAPLGRELAALCEVSTMEEAGALLGYDPIRSGLREPGREKFLHRLAMHIGHYRQTITSLGIPILYRREDDEGTEDRILLGPYVAPIDAAIAHRDDLARVWRRSAERHGVAYESIRDWVLCNNGFIDLRPHALATTAQEPGPQLEDHLGRFTDEAELVAWLETIETGGYFTTAGLVALIYRLRRLGEKVRGRKLRLGTRETWKHLFREDEDGRLLISPGLVETVRMYTEGLGKITGTEALWPRWGY
ncbi:MAG: hypothetical protein AAGC60_07695 [Acidobacteriota bacterium]